MQLKKKDIKRLKAQEEEERKAQAKGQTDGVTTRSQTRQTQTQEEKPEGQANEPPVGLRPFEEQMKDDTAPQLGELTPESWGIDEYTFKLMAPHKEPREGGKKDDEEEDDDFVVDRIVDFDPSHGGLFRIRWHGYLPSKDTWEPVEHIPRSQVVRFLKKSGRPLDESLLNRARKG